jgi:hypothetical protein
VYLGSATGLATAPATSLTGLDGVNANFGAVAGVGDVDGDGYADAMIGARAANGTGRAYVYLGSATGLATTPATSLTGPVANGNFGAVAFAGDVDADGYADAIVGAGGTLGAGAAAGHAYVYLGSATGLAATPAAILSSSDALDGYFGQAVASAGRGYHVDASLGSPSRRRRANETSGGNLAGI